MANRVLTREEFAKHCEEAADRVIAAYPEPERSEHKAAILAMAADLFGVSVESITLHAGQVRKLN